MPRRAPPIARVPLARSRIRLFGLPVLLILGGAAAIAGGLLILGGSVGVGVAAAGAALALAGLVGIVTLLSIRLDVEEAAVRVRWLGGERMYGLVPGPVTRVRLRGADASRLRAGPRLLPWQFGSGLLRGEEAVDVVRLAPTRTAILVPTDRGRLAIAPADEEVLLDALIRAARARQRLEELNRTAEPATEAASPAEGEDGDPALLTGIERALFEERLAQERAAAVAPPAPAITMPATPVAEVVGEAPAAVAPQRQSWLRRRDVERAAAARPRPSRRPGQSIVLVILPLLAAGAIWGLGLLTRRIPEPSTDLGRLTALALVLAGPGTTVGAIMARVWWPRLVGVVVAGGLAAAVFVGRSLIGA
jgi:hypothetical protein